MRRTKTNDVLGSGRWIYSGLGTVLCMDTLGGFKVMNEHVYKYFRWKAFQAYLQHRPMVEFFNYDFARQEREAQ